jgi:DNA-binding SARP family transcriptional activator
VPGSALVLLGGAHLGDRATGRPLPADRRGCLLAYLGFDGGWVERDRLALLFWPEADEQAAKRNLRQLLLRVRQLEWADGIEATAAALRWAVPTDVAAFRRALAVGDHEGALALYGGPLLAGFTVDGVAGYDAWLEYERERLHAGFHEATIRLAEAAVAQDRFDVARAGLGRLLELDPLAEDVLQAYLRTLLLDGRHAAAVAAYERFARLLDGELDLRPLAATQALAEAARQAVPIVPPAPIRTDPLPAGARRTPRLAARHDEVAALLAATTPIVLVAGEPGIGKTRLLREALPGALRIGAVEGLELVAYQPFASLVRSQPGLAATIGPYREDLARLVPEVAPELTPGLLDPSTGQARLAEALARVVDATGGPAGGRRPAVGGCRLVADAHVPGGAGWTGVRHLPGGRGEPGPAPRPRRVGLPRCADRHHPRLDRRGGRRGHAGRHDGSLRGPAALRPLALAALRREPHVRVGDGAHAVRGRRVARGRTRLGDRHRRPDAGTTASSTCRRRCRA